MAALWLQSVSLLVLLVVSLPSTQASPLPGLLCGSHLLDALNLVCGEQEMYPKPPRNENLQPVSAATRKERLDSLLDCCHKPCTLADLVNHCNWLWF